MDLADSIYMNVEHYMGLSDKSYEQTNLGFRCIPSYKWCIFHKDRLKVHRNGDKPAFIWGDGTNIWCYYGERHRNHDKPAYIKPFGQTIIYKWYKNGKVHRDHDLPSIINSDDSKMVSPL